MSDFSKMSLPIFNGVLSECAKVVAMDGRHPKVSMNETSYVLQGRTYVIAAPSGEYSFWFGVNGYRLFFITYIKDHTPESAKEAFSFCFGGAEKVGWFVNYEPIDNGVSIWACCMTDQEKPLIETAPFSDGGMTSPAVFQLTERGQFWVTDIAMMVQSWFRTSERRGIRCHESQPAPL